MKALVTGCAGFIGSALARRLLELGAEVVGVDRFSPYYAVETKRRNVQLLATDRRFQLVEADLSDLTASDLLEGCDYVFHEAGQAGVRSSWGSEFETYLRDNVLATQRLLEAAIQAPRLRKFVFASSSSVYGDAETYPTREDLVPRPVSPYGVTKLAAEQLCRLYARNFGVPTVSLRYFTVYGPGQRPDMGFHRFIRAMLRDEPITIYGDGEQTRDVTFIDDIVAANLLAAERGQPGDVYNVGGGHQVTVNQVLHELELVLGWVPRVRHVSEQKGDVRDT
ncbi:MAG TPA: NAD-dependent epimerase/dehydratase family protein, partial [Chloroflexota bacterium]|nr:NAD-dependent epimerase/dehydratase family protein [Chloroflexota bacterium]